VVLQGQGFPPSSARRSDVALAKMSKSELDELAPLYQKGSEYQAYANRYGSGGRFPDFRPARPQRERSIDPALLGSTAVGVGAFALMESIRASSDYGNAFSETTQMNTPDMYDSSDDLRDIGPMLQQAISRAIQLNEQTGSVPIDLKRQIGKLEALQNTKQSLDSADDRAIKSGFMDPMKTSGFGDRAEDRSMEELRDLQSRGIIGQLPSMEDVVIGREVQFQPSMPIDEGPPMVGPADPTPEQMRQMDATREIVPSMEDFGE